METYHVGLMALAFFAVMGFVAYWAWISKMRNQEKVIKSPQYVEGFEFGQKAQYVATVFAGRPLDRVVGHGFAHRGDAFVLVSSEGAAISRIGEKSFLIPAQDVLEVSQGSAVIDRAVEKDGLTFIRWNLGGVQLETYLRFVGASERSAAISKLRDLVA